MGSYLGHILNAKALQIVWNKNSSKTKCMENASSS